MIIANLMQLDHPDGIIRVSTLPYEWTDPEERVWLGGGPIISISERGPATGGDGGSISVVWSGASAALIAAAFEPMLISSRFEMSTVWLGDDGVTRIAGPMDPWAGLVETPSIIADTVSPSISIVVQSPLLYLGSTRRTLFDPETQQRQNANDTSANWVAQLADYRPALR